jgi:hypothetical protein
MFLNSNDRKFYREQKANIRLYSGLIKHNKAILEYLIEGKYTNNKQLNILIEMISNDPEINLNYIIRQTHKFIRIYRKQIAIALKNIEYIKF